MVDEPNNPWAAPPEASNDEPVWPPAVEPGDHRLDTMRLQTGRFTSPSLGAYETNGSKPVDAGATAAEDAHFAGFGSDTYRSDDQEVPAWADDSQANGAPDWSADAAAAGPAGFDRSSRFDHAVNGDFEDDLVDDDELEPANDARRNAIEWTVVLVGAVLLALVLRAVLLQAFWIPSPSMESTLLIRDRVLVNKVSYQFGDISRGDVVVFRRTEAEIAADPSQPRDVIKRVIGLEGETIDIVNNTVFIDGVAIDEPYLDDGVLSADFPPTLVPEGHVFVMGDNREVSLDSRFETGPVAEERIVGRAFFLFWPLNRLGSL